jgi:hypothetical protein
VIKIRHLSRVNSCNGLGVRSSTNRKIARIYSNRVEKMSRGQDGQ